MGWFERKRQDIINSPFFMAGTHRKITELENDSLLPDEILNILKRYDNSRDDAKGRFDDSERKHEEANSEAERYQSEYNDASTRLDQIKKQFGIGGKFFTKKRYTLLLGLAAGGIGALALGTLGGGIGLALGAAGVKMLGSAAYCNLTVAGKEYRRFKRIAKISQAKHDYYNDLSKIKGQEATIALEEMKKIDRHKNEFEKAIILQTKNYKDEFKLIREFDKLDTYKRTMFKQTFGNKAFNKLDGYIDIIRNNWFFNTNGIRRTCDINELTNILKLLRKGKEVTSPNATITQFVNNQLPVPNVMQPQHAQGQPTQGQPTQGQPTQGQPAQGQPAQGQPAQGQPTQGQPATPVQGPIGPKGDSIDSNYDPQNDKKTTKNFRDGLQPPVEYGKINREILEGVIRDINLYTPIDVNTADWFLAIIGYSNNTYIGEGEKPSFDETIESMRSNNIKGKDLSRYANIGVSILTNSIYGDEVDPELSNFVKVYRKAEQQMQASTENPETARESK